METFVLRSLEVSLNIASPCTCAHTEPAYFYCFMCERQAAHNRPGLNISLDLQLRTAHLTHFLLQAPVLVPCHLPQHRGTLSFRKCLALTVMTTKHLLKAGLVGKHHQSRLNGPGEYATKQSKDALPVELRSSARRTRSTRGEAKFPDSLQACLPRPHL